MRDREEPRVIRSVVCQGRSTGPSDVTFGRSESGNEQMGLVYDVTKGEFEGRRLTWYGTVGASDEALELVKETLTASGWDNSEPFMALRGLGSKDVSLAIDVLEIIGRGCVVREMPKLRYVNRLTQATMKQPIEGDELAALGKQLGARMRGLGANGRRPTSGGASPEEERAYDADDALDSA
jgi:hypothetical protein